MKFGKLLIIISSAILKGITTSLISASHYQPLVKVNSVSQLAADVNHQDWGFQALQSLKEQYGCSNKSLDLVKPMARQQFVV